MNDLLAPTTSINNNEPAPFARQMIILSKQEYIELKAQVSYYQSQHERALSRELALKKALAQEEAKVRDLTQRLYGKKSEARKKSEHANTSDAQKEPRSRGQQPGSKGHGRTQRPHLPVIAEVRDLANDEKQCPCCGLPYKPLNTEDSELIEVEVRAYKRRIKRQKYVSQCQCSGAVRLVTAPLAPRLIPRTRLGVSVWVELLLDKYQQAQATHRYLNYLASLGCPISQGTITGGLALIAPMLESMVDTLLEKQLTERLFHADETGWKVFEAVADKANFCWYLWLLQSPSVAYFIMAPGRNAEVPIEHFEGLCEGEFQVFLVCDRYSAYKKLAKYREMIVLAFCWAHVRRDFLDAARSWPELEEWMFQWVTVIGELYSINKRRLKHWNPDLPISDQSSAFEQHQQTLLQTLSNMKKQRDACLAKEELHSAQCATLTSLKNHWSGLALFAEHPQIPMDNNAAERGLRNPVTGRKRYYGSGCQWSAKLAAMMFSILQTLQLWKINPRHWFTAYLTACAENQGKAPPDLSLFLPWSMSEERLRQFRQPLPVTAIGEQQATHYQDTG